MAITTTRPTFGGGTGGSYSSTSTQVSTSAVRYVEKLAESLDYNSIPLTKMFGFGEAVDNYKVEWTDDRFGPVADQLNEALDNSETGIDVDNGSRFQVYDVIKVEDELMWVSSISSNTLTVTRGWAGTTAASHADNTEVEIVGPAVPENVSTPASPMARGEFYYNYSQIFDYGWQISNRQNASNNYTIRGKEYNFEVSKKFKEASKDLERTIFRGVRVDISGTAPSAMGGFPTFITQGVTAKSGAYFTEADLMTLLQARWRDVGPDNLGLTVICDIFAKRVIGSWVDGLRRLEARTTSVSIKLDTLETDFGTLEFVPHFHCPTNRLYVIDPSNFEIRPHAGNGRWHDRPLPADGGYLKGQLYGDYTLMAKGDRAHCQITGFSTTVADYPSLQSQS